MIWDCKNFIMTFATISPPRTPGRIYISAGLTSVWTSINHWFVIIGVNSRLIRTRLRHSRVKPRPGIWESRWEARYISSNISNTSSQVGTNFSGWHEVVCAIAGDLLELTRTSHVRSFNKGFAFRFPSASAQAPIYFRGKNLIWTSRLSL